MNKTLLDLVPNEVVLAVIKSCLEESKIEHLETDTHWSEFISDKVFYKALLLFYFPDEKESLTPILEGLSEAACLSFLLHGIPYRYGHLLPIQQEYLVALLSKNYAKQTVLLEKNAQACLGIHYVSEREVA